MCGRSTIQTAICFIIFAAPMSISDDAVSKASQAFDDRVKKVFQEISDAAMYLEKQGIDPAEIRPDILLFDSTNLLECVELVCQSANGEDELSKAVYSCVLRHPLSQDPALQMIENSNPKE